MARPHVEDLPDPAVHVTRYAEALTVSNAKGPARYFKPTERSPTIVC